MKPWARYLLNAVMAAGFLIVPAFTNAETCTLEIKRLEGSRNMYSPSDYMFRATSSQYFNAQIGSQGGPRLNFGQENKEAAFKKIVTKEPKYESDHPFRGVAKFGTKSSPLHWTNPFRNQKKTRPHPMDRMRSQ
jgi:hypothetical protein